jgi:hypothetical protein
MQLTGPQIGVLAGSVLPDGSRDVASAGAHGTTSGAPQAVHATPAADAAITEPLTYTPAAPRGAAGGASRGVNIDVRA